jgi:hypothetical protein
MKRLTCILALLVVCAATIHPAGIVSGTTACPSSGSVRISSTGSNYYQLDIQAPYGNAGTVYVGGSGVTSTTGIALVAGATYTQVRPSPTLSATAVYFSCSNSADSVVWAGGQ